MAYAKYSDEKLAAEEGVLDTPEMTLHLGGPRRYDPDAGASAETGASMSLLVDMCSGDWSWKPDRRLVITGPICTCTLQTSTGCPRHDGSYAPPTKNPPRAVVYL